MWYSDDDLLMLSGIQHIAFCERQYALAYMEMQWLENVLTIKGHHFHERVDDPFIVDIRGNTITWRSLSIISYRLGLYGKADMIELVEAGNEVENAIEIYDKKGRWRPVPVEFKKGRPKEDVCDEVQLCAQAICLEEMYRISIQQGYLYYGETKHRHKVELNGMLREQVETYAKKMHEIFNSGITPRADYKPHCKSCSLTSLCLPKSMGDHHSGSEYLRTIFDNCNSS